MTDVQGQDQFKPVANRRAGYSDQLYWAMRQAKKGGTLAAGEGLAIIEHYEEQLAALRSQLDGMRFLAGGWKRNAYAFQQVWHDSIDDLNEVFDNIEYYAAQERGKA